MTTRPPDTPSGNQATLLTILLAAVILAGLWFGPQLLNPQANQAASAPSPTSEAEDWPTVEATFTPRPTATTEPTATLLPTATPPPQPTPIIFNQQRISEQAVMSFTASAAQVMQSEDARVFGIPVPRTSEKITVEYVARVKIGYDTSKIVYQQDKTTIIVKLPPLEIVSIDPDWEASRIVDTDQRLIGSDIAQLQKEAWGSAEKSIETRVMSDSELLFQAQRYAKLILEEQLRKLGFVTIIIT